MPNRREFLKSSAAAAIVPASALGRGGAIAPGDRTMPGFIGCGNMGQGDMKNFLPSPGARIVAVCDSIRWRREQARPYRDFRELLARPDIDAVSIATLNSWHVPHALAAVRAGKHIPAQKPQWGSRNDATGPLEIQGKAVWPKDDALCDNPASWGVHYSYADGVTVHFTGSGPGFDGAVRCDTICQLAWIAFKLEPKLKWDPAPVDAPDPAKTLEFTRKPEYDHPYLRSSNSPLDLGRRRRFVRLAARRIFLGAAQRRTRRLAVQLRQGSAQAVLLSRLPPRWH
jgi:hypothetical protein